MNPIQTSLPLTPSLPVDLSTGPGSEFASKLKSLAQGGINDQTEKMASEFESVFVSLMLKEMRNTLDGENGGLFGGEGSDTFGGMFDLFMGQHLSKSSPFGIADAIKGFLNNVPLDAGQNSQSSPTDETG